MGETRGFGPDSKVVRLAEGSAINATALSFERAGPPDVQLRVNNADSQLAALILERISGERYAQLVSERLWSPLGAGAATLNLDGLEGDARAFCCMRARPVDWLRLGALLDNGGRVGEQQIVPEAFVEEMKRGGPVNPLVGLSVLQGWDVADDPALARFTIIPQSEPFASPGLYHLLGGRSITLWIAPAHDLMVFRWGDDVKDWDNSFIINAIVAGIEE